MGVLRGSCNGSRAVGVWPTQNVIISQLVDSIIEDNLIVNVLNEAFHAQANRLRFQRGREGLRSGKGYGRVVLSTEWIYDPAQ